MPTRAKSALEHSDHILKAPQGSWVLVCEPVHAVNMGGGGQIAYKPGDRLRVRQSLAGLLWCDDEQARRVTFDRQEMAALDRAAAATDGGER